jgi:hypothetical protein
MHWHVITLLILFLLTLSHAVSTHEAPSPEEGDDDDGEGTAQVPEFVLDNDGHSMDTAAATPSSPGDDDDGIPYYAIHQNVAQREATLQRRSERFSAYAASNNASFTTIRCRNHKDLYQLLHRMCLLSVVCSERYSLDQSVLALDNVALTAQERTYYSGIAKINFKKFVYRLSLPHLFILQDSNASATAASTALNTQSLFLLEDKVPLQWLPPYIIQLTHDANDSCLASVDLYAPESVPFVYSTQYLMHVYSLYVRNDYECHHINEWLYLDSQGRPHCGCRQGKSCDNEGNYAPAIITIAVILIVIIIASIISFFVTTPRLIAKIDATNKLKHKQL